MWKDAPQLQPHLYGILAKPWYALVFIPLEPKSTLKNAGLSFDPHVGLSTTAYHLKKNCESAENTPIAPRCGWIAARLYL